MFWQLILEGRAGALEGAGGNLGQCVNGPIFRLHRNNRIGAIIVSNLTLPRETSDKNAC